MPINFNTLQSLLPQKSGVIAQLPSGGGGEEDGMSDFFSGLSSLVGTFKGKPSTTSPTASTDSSPSYFGGVNPGYSPQSLQQAVSGSINTGPYLDTASLYKRPAFQEGLQAHRIAAEQGITKSPIMTVIDYSIPSNQPRLFTIDTRQNKVLLSTYVAQGKTPGFSNTPASHQSSLGTFKTGNVYNSSKVGQALKIEGLNPGVNDNAFSRGIIVHGGNYVGKDKQGTSWGCFTVPNDVAPKLIGMTQGGSIIHAYAPSQKTLNNFSSNLVSSEGRQVLKQNIGSQNSNDQFIPNELEHVKAGIAYVESSGSKDPYTLKSKPSRNGDRAYGKYQIMGNNIPSWSSEALGYPITKDQFLASPELQEKIAEYHMKKAYDKYGNADDVYSTWFSGRPVNKAGNAKDVYGTTVPAYIKKARQGYLKSRESKIGPTSQNNVEMYQRGVGEDSNQGPDKYPMMQVPQTQFGPQGTTDPRDMATQSNLTRLASNNKMPYPPATTPNIPAFDPRTPIRDLSPKEIEAIMKNLHGSNINWNLLQLMNNQTTV